MFTGIIEELGKIENVRTTGGGLRLRVLAPGSAGELRVNDSVSINGVCQTVMAKNQDSFEVEAVEETLKKTTLSSLRAGYRINLELPLKLNDRLGGHLVLGHVDTVGRITRIEAKESSWLFETQIPREFLKYVVPVGSIAIDGVSLTIAGIQDDSVHVSIIPQTMENTIFKFYKINDPVNIEFDIIGKYIDRLRPESGATLEEKVFLSEDHLRELGY